jgi:molecular chaperone HscB
MNYFEFYELPISFDLDTSFLKRQFYAMSKKYHPDFFINESEARQEEVLELSTLNNKAYQVLSDPDRRLAYILELFDLLKDGDKYQLDPAFLMEMMEMNEALMDAADGSAVQAVKQQIDGVENELDQLLKYHVQHFDQADEAEQKQKLLKIRDIYYRKKYLLRIKDSLNTFATR